MKIAAITPDIHTADCDYNASLIAEASLKAYEAGCRAAVFPAFVVSGCTCGSLFHTATLKQAVRAGLVKIKKASEKMPGLLIAAGFPEDGESCVAIIYEGEILSLVSSRICKCIELDGVTYDVAGYFTFTLDGSKAAFTAPEIVCDPVSGEHVLKGLEGVPGDCDTVFCSWSGEMYAGCVREYLQAFAAESVRLNASVISVSAGPGESTDDCVYSGLKAFTGGGRVADYSLKPGSWIFETDSLKAVAGKAPGYRKVFGFMPEDDDLREEYCLDIMRIQAEALGRRLKLLGMKKAVLGLSGGLDSTLALVATANTFDRYGLNRRDILCITMPGFGTSAGTKRNALRLAEAFGVSLKEIDIREQTALHLSSIEQPFTEKEGGERFFKADVTFENAQARIRTLILMDIANKEGALAIGTGDMSELALGWCTYNGDHMSMYSVNSGIPKTAIAPILKTYADCVAEPEERRRLSDIFEDITGTPVSPELLPVGEDGSIVQKTEDSLGPYELHDFFLYSLLYEPFKEVSEIYEAAVRTFKDRYEKERIKETFIIFIRRFFTHQFKRSCLPAGPKAFKHSLSPRGGFLMPGDAYADEWLGAL